MDQKGLIFDILKHIADGIAKTFNRNCEVAVHDLTNLRESLVYLAGNVTKRKVGAPITDMVVRELRQHGSKIKDRYNYRTTTDDGRTVKSTTVFLRNKKDKVIAAFCINFDTTDFANAHLALETFLKTNDLSGNNKTEHFAMTVEETIGALFQQAVSEIGKKPTSMTTGEKIALIEILVGKGTFLIKGAVDQVALMLGVSKFTVYSYLQKIRAVQAIEQS